MHITGNTVHVPPTRQMTMTTIISKSAVTIKSWESLFFQKWLCAYMPTRLIHAWYSITSVDMDMFMLKLNIAMCTVYAMHNVPYMSPTHVLGH